MATEVKRRRGTTVEHSTFTGAVAELTVDLTKDTVVVHDGATQAGFPLLREDFSNVPTTAPFTHITLDTAIFDTTYTETESETQGTLYWNQDEETLSLVTNGQTIELGQKIEVHVKNQTGSQIDKGEVVYASGTLGASGRILVTKMIADGTIAAKRILGVAAENIANGADGKVVKFGKIRKVDTSAYSNGDILWVSTTVAGAFQNTEPSQSAGDIALPIAYVVYSSSNNGEIFVRVTPIDENEYQNYDAGLTDIAGLTPTDSNFIVGDGTNWVAESGATARASLGAQAQDPQLDDIAGLTPTDGNFIVGNGTNFVAESGNTARTSLGLGTSDSPTFDGLTSTGVIITDEIDTTSITWNVSTLEWDADPSEKFNNPVFIGTSLDVDNGINADQHIHAGTYLKADTYLEVGTSATIGTTLDVSGNTTIGGTLSVTGNTTISGTLDAPTLNTGQGDNELYAMNQNVRTSDSVTFDTLAVTNNATVGGTLGVTGDATFDTSILLDAAAKFESEEGYLSGFTGSGFNLSKVSSLYRLELDDMFIRGALFASELIINQISAINGSDILSPGRGKVESIASNFYTVSDPQGGNYASFAVGDIVIVQQVRPNDNQLIKRIVRTVTDVTDNVVELAVLSGAPSDSGAIQVGDIIVAIGSTSNADRQANIFRTVTEADSPYVRVNDGISSWAHWTGYDKLKLQYGNLDNLNTLHSNVSGYGFYGENTFLTGALLVGDLSKASNYLEYNGSALNVVTGTFNLATPTLVIDSTNNKVALGTSANSITIDGTEVGFIADGAGEFKAYADANNYIRLANSALDIKAESFDLETSTVVLNSASNGRLIVGADADNQLVDDGVGFFVTGDGNFRVGTIQQGSDSYIKFDGSTVSIVTDTFDLAAGSMTIDSTDGITIGNNDFFKQDKTFSFGGGILSGTSSTVSISGSGATIDVSTFNLNATTLVIDSATNSGKIALGATPPTGITTGSGIYFDGTGDALIGDATGNRIKFDFSASALEIQSDDFDLSAGNLLIDSGTTSLGGYTPTNATSIITNADFSSTVNFKDHPLDPSTPSNPSGDFGYLDDSVGWEADRTGSSTFSYDASGDYVQFTIDSSNGSNAIKMWQDEGWSDSGTSGTLSSYFGKTLTYTFDIRTAPTANGFQYGELFLRVYAYKNITDNTQASGYDYFQIAETKIVSSDLSGSSSTSIDVSAVIRSDYQAIRWSVEFDNFDTTSKAQDQYIFVYDVTLGAYDQTKVTLNSNGLSVFNSPIKQFTADSNGFEMVGMDIKTGGLQVPDIGSVQNLKTPDVGYLSVGAVDVGSSFRLYIKDSDGNAKYVTISTS
jgi:hypothetical protein